jgi:hypothetical protein
MGKFHPKYYIQILNTFSFVLSYSFFVDVGYNAQNEAYNTAWNMP